MQKRQLQRARPVRLCFYRMDSEDEQLSSACERLVLWNVTGECKDAFLADVAPILSVELRQDMIDQIAKIENKVVFEGKARDDLDTLVQWIVDSNKPVIGYQEERVEPGSPNITKPEAIKDRDDVLIFYLMDSFDGSVSIDNERFVLDSMMGAFEADIAPYLTVEKKRDLLERIPGLLVDFGADEKAKQTVTRLVSWLRSSPAEYVGFQYEPVEK